MKIRQKIAWLLSLSMITSCLLTSELNIVGKAAETIDFDVASAIQNLQTGEELHIPAGIYSLNDTIFISQNNSGTADAPKKVIADGEVIFDFSAMELNDSNRGMVLDGSYWYIYGITFKGAGDNGMLLSGSHNTLEMCVFTENRDSGLQISRYRSQASTIDQWPSYNLIKNCTAFNNSDEYGENADGFAAKLTCGEGNVFDGCMSYNNSDDGWDLYAKAETGPIGVLTIQNCIAFRNGKLTSGEGSPSGDMNGFKMGGSGIGTPHKFINCLAFENGAHGFSDNNNPSALEVLNCTSTNNSIYTYRTKSNFSLRLEEDGINKNLLSYNPTEIGCDQFVGSLQNSIISGSDLQHRVIGDAITVTKKTNEGEIYYLADTDFYSVTAPGKDTDFHKAWRDADGSINTHGFMEVMKNSPVATLAEDGGALGARLSDEQADAEKIYAAADGSTDGDGSGEHPYDLQTAIDKSKDGMEIHLAEGVYEFATTILIPKTMSAPKDAHRKLIADGRVILDFSGHDPEKHDVGLQLNAWNWDVMGIRIKGAGSYGMRVGGSYNIIENCVFEGNGDSGLGIINSSEWPAYNLVKNCTAFNNYDSENGGENADGFAAKVFCGEGNVFDGCIAYNNSDDGWDLFAKPESGPIGSVTIRNCVAFRNGIILNGDRTDYGDGNGFKLGGGAQPTVHTVINCLAFENIQSGFTDNSNPDCLVLKNCTAVNNSLGYTTKNYSFGKETNGIKTNVLSYVNQSIPTISRDVLRSTIDHSIFLGGGLSQQYVEDALVVESNAVVGQKVTMTDADFYSVTAPDSLEDIHTLFRDADGNIDLHGLYEIKKGTAYATMADDGGSIGSRLSNEQGYTETENPDLRKESYTMPKSDLTLEGDVLPDLHWGTYTQNFALGDYTITATEAKSVMVDLMTTKNEEFNFQKRVNMGGSGNKNYRSILYEAKTSEKMIIYGMSHSPEEARNLQLCRMDGTVVETISLEGGTVHKIEFTIPEAGQYYITSAHSGWYLYYLETQAITPDGNVSDGDVSDGDVSDGDIPLPPPPAVHEGLEVFLTNPEESYVYNGKPQTPQITVLFDGAALIPGKDYTVKYSNNINASTEKKQGTITVTGKGNLSGTVKTTFVIAKASMADVTAGELYVLQGKAVKPVLSYEGMLLGSKDYMPVLSGDTLTVTGKGNYQGTKEIPVHFVTQKSELQNLTVRMDKEIFYYDGKEKLPETLQIFDKATGEKLVKNQDYTVIFPDNVVDAGTVKFTVVGMGKYTGSVSKSYVIKPYQYQAGKSQITVTSAPSTGFVSTGATLSDICVMIDGNELQEGIDYQVKYSANKQAGTAGYTVSFLGNYKGVPVQRKTFQITPAKLSEAKILFPDMQYKKAGVYQSKPIVSVDGALVKSSDYAVTYYLSETMENISAMSKQNPVEITEEMKNAGVKEVMVYVKVQGKGKNLSAAEKDCGIGAYKVVLPAAVNLSKAKVIFKNTSDVSQSKFEYSGKPVEPKVVLMVGKETVPASAYEVNYISNVSRGKATVLITANGTDAKYSGSKTANFSIVSQKFPVDWLKELFGNRSILW